MSWVYVILIGVIVLLVLASAFLAWGWAINRGLLMRPGPMSNPADTMEEADYWAIIEHSKSISLGSLERMEMAIRATLEQLTEDDLIKLHQIQETLLRRAHTWGVHMAIWLIEGHNSGDGVEYFKCWLIAQGQECFEKAVADPDSLADANLDDSADGLHWFEPLLDIPASVYRERTGREVEGGVVAGVLDFMRRPSGQRFATAEVPVKFPKPWAKYGAIRKL